jgi:hypothetical protein
MTNKGRVTSAIAASIIRNRIMPLILKEVNVEVCSEALLTALTSLFEVFLLNLASFGREYATFFGRHRANTVDFYQTLIDCNADLPSLVLYIKSLKASSNPQLKLLLDKPGKTSASMGSNGNMEKLWSFTEKPKYIYEFHPSLPPSHTYKHTPAKAKRDDDKGILLQKKALQSRQAELGLVDLMRLTGNFPTCANYSL